MQLTTAIILFFITFMVVQNQKECATTSTGGHTSTGPAGSFATGGSAVGQSYNNVGFLDGLARTIDPTWGRTHSTFHFTSPESWQPGMFPNNKASMLNVAGRAHVTGIPSVPGTSPPYSGDPQPFNIK
jgi:hypothetical protein